MSRYKKLYNPQNVKQIDISIRKELFIYLFDICEYFPNSDCLIQKVFKIIGNIFKARNEDVSEMVRYLLEDT